MKIIERIAFHNFGDRDFNFDNLTINFNQLNLFAGANGVGKSFLFKAAWYMAFTLQLRQAHSLVQNPNADKDFKEEADFVFDMTFFDSQNLSGAIQISDEKSEIYIYTISFQEGKIEYFNLDIKDLEAFKLGEITQVKYASKETRTFEGYERYLNTKNNFGVNSFKGLDDFKKFNGIYKIYDILWYENILTTLKHFEDNPQSFEKIKEMWAMIIDGQGGSNDASLPTADSFVAKDGHLYIKREDDTLKNISKESSGTQAFTMLTLFSGGF
jgi:predicted ATPase